MLPGYNDSTMWGPQGDPNQERGRLKPGDRLADGQIFQGDNPEAVLLAALKHVEHQLTPLVARRNQILRKLVELKPELYSETILPEEGEITIPTGYVEASEPAELALTVAAIDPPEPHAIQRFEPFMEMPLYLEQVDLTAPSEVPTANEAKETLTPAVTSVRRPKRKQAE